MVLEAIRNRRAVRQYRPDGVSQEAVDELLKAAMFAPTARNKKSVEFVVVRDAATKNRIYEALMPSNSPQEFVREAPLLIVPASDTSKSPDLSVQDCSVASMAIFLQAAEMGLGTVWKNVKSKQAGKIREILGIPPGWTVVNVIPVGYAKEQPRPHEDGDYVAAKVHHERW